MICKKKVTISRIFGNTDCICYIGVLIKKLFFGNIGHAEHGQAIPPLVEVNLYGFCLGFSAPPQYGKKGYLSR